MKRRWIIGLTLCALVGAAAWYRIRAAPSASDAYIATSARVMDLESAIVGMGVVEPTQVVSVGAQVSGRLLSLKVNLGDHVVAGQLIGEIDSVPQTNIVRKGQASLAGLYAQRDHAQATLKQAQLAFRRQTMILAGKAGTRQEYETAEATLAGATADIANLTAQIDGASIDVDIARINLGYTKITAPIEGTVVAIMTRQGQTVIASQIAPVIVKLADLRTMTVKARISEADVARLRPGQPVHFMAFSQPNRRYETVLRTIEPAPDQIASDGSVSVGGSADSSAVYFNGRFDIRNDDGILRPFMTAEVSFVLASAKQAIVVSSATLRNRKGDKAHLLVLDAAGTAHDRAVHVGIESNAEVQIVDGLKAGERVVLAGPDDLDSAQKGAGS